MIIYQEGQPPVSVQRHQPDMEDPGAEVWKRIESFTGQTPTCLYVNPIGTVSCDEPIPEFFRAAREFQATWCQRYKSLFGRRALRSAKDWVTWKGYQTREARYWDRAACFTGILFINDQFIPPHRWPDRKQTGQNRRQGRIRANAKNLCQQEKDPIQGIDESDSET